jgi:hypothetical protein
MRSAGLVTAGLAMTKSLCLSHLLGGDSCYPFLDHSKPLNGGSRLPGAVGYFAAFLWVCFVSLIGAAVAVGRTIRPSLKTAA